MKDQTRAKIELRRYIDSMGEDVPLDWHNYQEGAMFETHCVFCGQTHNGHEVYLIDPVTSTKKELGVHSCNDCNNHVANMLAIEYGYGEVSDIPYKGEGIDTSHIDEEEIRDARLSKFLYELKFFAGIYKYYTHLDHSTDRYVDKQQNIRCAFCDRSVLHKSSDANWRTIETPVEGVDYITGGKVYICEVCDKKDLINKAMAKAFNTGLWIKIKCDSCKNEYRVTAEAKQIMNDDDAYSCYSCTYHALNNMPNGDIRYMAENHYPREDTPTRFKPMNCGCCYKPFYLDLTMSVKHIMDKYVVKRGKEEIILCKSCADLGFKKFLLQKFLYQFTDSRRFYIVILPMSKVDALRQNWIYEIVKLDPKKGAEVLSRSYVIENEKIYNVLLMANDYCWNIIRGDQPELWDTKE